MSHRYDLLENAQRDMDAMESYRHTKRFSVYDTPLGRAHKRIENLEAEIVGLKTNKQVTIKGLPEGTTHVSTARAFNKYGSCFIVHVFAFKYDNGILKNFCTDNDGEYPEWRDASRLFNKIPEIEPV